MPAALAAALIAAGCGGSESGGAYGGGETERGSAAASNSATSGAVVSAAMTPELGKVLVDSQGHTLYVFQKDMGGRSSCYGGCEQVWPPLTGEGAPQAGEGAMAGRLGTSPRRDGSVQVTYAGHPLYTYVEDSKPGDTNGNGFNSFGGLWHALKPSGEETGG